MSSSCLYWWHRVSYKSWVNLPGPSGYCVYAKACQMTPVPMFRWLNQDLGVYKQNSWLSICVCGMSRESYRANFSNCMESTSKHSEEVSSLVWDLPCQLPSVKTVPLSSADTCTASPTSIHHWNWQRRGAILSITITNKMIKEYEWKSMHTYGWRLLVKFRSSNFLFASKVKPTA